MARNWTCPFCNRAQLVTGDNSDVNQGPLWVGESKDGKLASWVSAVACLNKDCQKTSVTVAIARAKFHQNGSFSGLDFANTFFWQQVLPQGSAKPQPEIVPAALREDYLEACLIRDLSPKASATLIRRCLQGMIRDFAKISKPTLDQEIKALRAAVEEGSAERSISLESVEAIDHVRGIGNIGAHMEKDIDLIVPVDAGEAQALIELVEMLFEEWYVAREIRKRRLSRIEGIASEKKAIKSQNALAAPVVTLPTPEA